MSFQPDAATAAWVLTGVLALFPIVILPAMGFLLARETKRRDKAEEDSTAQNKETRQMIAAVEKLVHETQLMVRDLREWVGENCIKRPEYTRDHQIIREDLQAIRNKLPNAVK